MFTDIVGYTSLTQRNESLAMELLGEQRDVVRSRLASFGGKEIKTIGDAFLVEFDSALDAVKCGVAIQKSFHDLNTSRPVAKRILLRVGVHLGDVIHVQDDVYGDAVNVASRIEPIAAAGGMCVSHQVHDQVKNKVDFQFESVGKRGLKNVLEQVEVFKVVFPWEREEVAAKTMDRMRIAVLPFTNLSSDPEEGYFADGVTEELITAISGVRQLTVIARTSVTGYKGTTMKVKDIAQELDVGTILEGSVRKAGNRVRITAQLIDAATEGHLWAQNYDRQLEDVFAIQSEIAEKVAGELKIRLVEEEKRVIEKKPTENTEAYTFYLRGKELIRERTEASLKQAIEVLGKATELDPAFAKAHAAIAEALVTFVAEGYGSYEQAMPRAEIAVKKALKLDPELADAYAILAQVDFQEDDVLGSEVAAKRAIELNPSLPEAYFVYSNVALLKGETDAGMKAAETCFNLDPARPRYSDRLGQFYFFLGREDEAVRLWEKTAQLSPAGTYRGLAEYHLYKGNLEKAREYFSKAQGLEPTNRWSKWMKGFLAARGGDKDGAVKVIEDIENKWLGATNLNDVGYIYYALGDMDSYFTYMNRATDQHTLRYVYFMYCPLFEGARSDPRYQLVLEKLKKTYEGV